MKHYKILVDGYSVAEFAAPKGLSVADKKYKAYEWAKQNGCPAVGVTVIENKKKNNLK